jgi:hypothetical protein
MIAMPAVAADQFDLVCKSGRSEARYRIDLGSGEWCQDDCKGTARIASVTSGILTLVDQKPVRPNDIAISVIINRATGRWYRSVSMPRDVPTITDGICEPSDFTGFPITKF